MNQSFGALTNHACAVYMGASQSAPLFSSQGSDQGVGHFKGYLNREILQVHWNVRSLKSPTMHRKNQGASALTKLPYRK